MPRRYYSSTAARTTLSSGINSSVTSITVASTSGFPASYPYTLIIDQDLVTEEIVTVTAGSGTTLTVTRGADGTSAVAHSASAPVNHGVSARDFDEPNAHVNDSTTDVHPQYVLNSLVQNTKGAVPVGTGSAVAALSPGANGEILYADSSATNGLRYQPAYNTGRNRFINGDFSTWQRGTSFTITPTQYAYTADRWEALAAGSNATVSRQTFTPGAAPVAGYEGTYFLRYATTDTTTGHYLRQKIEDVRTFAGQTVTISFWAKVGSGTKSLRADAAQNFGSGGSSDVIGIEFLFSGSSTVTATTSWQRFTGTVTVPSVSGKTIGASSYLIVAIVVPSGNATLDVWGVQVEAGNVATRFEEEPFEATLRKCQRYYYLHASNDGDPISTGFQYADNYIMSFVQLPTSMRIGPSLQFTSGSNFYNAYLPGVLQFFTGSSWFINVSSPNAVWLFANNETGLGALGSNNKPLITRAGAGGRIAFSAEL